MYANLAILALFVFFYSLVSRDIGKTPFNGAVVFTAFGLLPFPLREVGLFLCLRRFRMPAMSRC